MVLHIYLLIDSLIQSINPSVNLFIYLSFIYSIIDLFIYLFPNCYHWRYTVPLYLVGYICTVTTFFYFFSDTGRTLEEVRWRFSRDSYPHGCGTQDCQRSLCHRGGGLAQHGAFRAAWRRLEAPVPTVPKACSGGPRWRSRLWSLYGKMDMLSTSGSWTKTLLYCTAILLS